VVLTVTDDDEVVVKVAVTDDDEEVTCLTCVYTFCP
jgi:hypothetical protein